MVQHSLDLRRLAPIALVALALAGCPSPKTPVMPPASNTDLTTLGRFIKLPYQPTRAEFQTGSLSSGGAFGIGPDDWGLVAVIEFAPDDFAALLAAAPLQPDVQPDLPEALFFDWLPEALRARSQGRSHGYVTLDAAPRDPQSLVKEPLLTGFAATFDDEPRLLVFLYTR